MKNNPLDQFYTKREVSNDLVKRVFLVFPEWKKYQFVESSAGNGSFVFALLENGIKLGQIKAYDIQPKDCVYIEKSDYLKSYFAFDRQKIMIGNPPFSTRGKLALEFLNKGLSECPIVALIVPKIFRRYSIQKRINANAKLIQEWPLPVNSFLVNNKEFNVNCVFQIWILSQFVNSPIALKDQRLCQPKPIKSNDFETFIHNNTNETLKYFNKEKYHWDFAVYRQGYYDYNKKFYKPQELFKNRQYCFIRYSCDIAKKIFNRLDFVKLSNSNTTVKGFSLTDLVEEYNTLKQRLLERP